MHAEHLVNGADELNEVIEVNEVNEVMDSLLDHVGVILRSH